MTKKLILMLLIAVLLISACKKADTAAGAADASGLPDEQISIASEIQKIREAAKEALSSNETPSDEGQIVYMPAEQQAAQNAGSGIVSQAYLAPCVVAKYRGLNVYCKAKNFWHNQSTLFSWYIPYSVVALIALIFFITIIWHLWRSR